MTRVRMRTWMGIRPIVRVPMEKVPPSVPRLRLCLLSRLFPLPPVLRLCPGSLWAVGSSPRWRSRRLRPGRLPAVPRVLRLSPVFP